MLGPIDVSVRLFASLREIVGAGEVALSVPRGSPVGAVWGYLSDRVDIGPAPTGLRYAINDEWTLPGARLQPGDRVALILPVSGG